MNVVVLSVSGEGCANCVSMLPLLRKLTRERGVELQTIEASAETAARIKALGVDRVPATVVLKDGAPFAVATGYQPEEILGLWLDAKLAEARA